MGEAVNGLNLQRGSVLSDRVDLRRPSGINRRGRRSVKHSVSYKDAHSERDSGTPALSRPVTNTGGHCARGNTDTVVIKAPRANK
ncbi:unnamed protein product, partial [Iphiclides podalirius]